MLGEVREGYGIRFRYFHFRHYGTLILALHAYFHATSQISFALPLPAALFRYFLYFVRRIYGFDADVTCRHYFQGL